MARTAESAMSAKFDGYERFVYRKFGGGDLAPPHGIWDCETNSPAESGTFGTEAEARACAEGMNKGRELCLRVDRLLAGLLVDLKRAVAKLEALQ